jgi:hypothetical protein
VLVSTGDGSDARITCCCEEGGGRVRRRCKEGRGEYPRNRVSGGIRERQRGEGGNR